MQKVIDEGDGYRIRATRKDIGTFGIVAVDWEHPNYGYFADAMLWYCSVNDTRWKPVPVAGWAGKYAELESFLSDYPDFADFFEELDWKKEIGKAIRRELKRKY